MLIAVSRRRFAAFLGSLVATALPRRRNRAALLQAAKQKDRTAFDQLMEIHSPRIRRFAERRLPRDDAEDVLQDTWIAAWDRIITVDKEENFPAWVLAICYRKIQDHWRRHHTRYSKNVPIDSAAEPAYLPQEFNRFELQQALKPFWESCAPDQREMLRLYYGDGLTLDEISKVLDRNLNTVKYQFYRLHDNAAKEMAGLSPVLLQPEGLA
jgi:RNA polymerase sigma-70 factor (ECF subfamily)